MRRTGKILVQVDPRYFRPTEVDLLIGDPRKAHDKLGWTHTTSFDDLVAEMVARRPGERRPRAQPDRRDMP